MQGRSDTREGFVEGIELGDMLGLRAGAPEGIDDGGAVSHKPHATGQSSLTALRAHATSFPDNDKVSTQKVLSLPWQKVGVIVGLCVGAPLGLAVGFAEGPIVGLGEGCSEG